MSLLDNSEIFLIVVIDIDKRLEMDEFKHLRNV